MKKILALFAVLLITIGYFNMPDMVSSAIPSVYYVTPNMREYENTVNCAGTVKSAEIYEVYLKETLVISKVYAQIGDEVNSGDLLARVDTSATEKFNASPQSLLLGLSGNLDGAQGGGMNWLALASDLGLTSALMGGDIDYSRLQNTLQSGGSAVDAPTSGAVAVASVPDELTSPVSGTVIEVNLLTDSPAATGKAAFTIADTENFIVLASVSESDIAKINVGDFASVRGVGFGGNVYYGEVSKIYPTAKKSLTGNEMAVDVEITLIDPDINLKHGFSAKVEIMGENNYELVTVPYEAIRQDENNNEYVYVYEDGKLKKQIVTTGQELTNDVEILSGISMNSIVVYNPSELVKEGVMISIKGRADK